MKATKVLGIVLGALLVAALFTGAAAADDTSLGDVEVYHLYKELPVDGALVTVKGNLTWTSELGSVTFIAEENSDMYYLSGDDIVPGKYYKYIGNTNYFINVKYPTKQVTGFITENGKTIATLIGNTVDVAKGLNFTGFDAGKLAFTNPSGTLTATNLSAFGIPANVSGQPYNYTDIKALDLGKWTVQAVFTKEMPAYSNLSPDFMYGKEYYFTVVKENTDASISTVDSEIIQGQYATIVVEAPRGEWKISVDEAGSIPKDQAGLTKNTGKSANITVPVSGVASFTVKAEKNDNIKVTLHNQDDDSTEDSLTIKVKAASISAEAEATSVFIGNEIDLFGTNDLGGNLVFYIKGTNYPFQVIKEMTASGKEWTKTLKTGELTNGGKKPDAGTYTIYVVSTEQDSIVEKDLDNTDKVRAYTTVSLALKQPFITITSAPEVVTHGDKLVVKGTAEGKPTEVRFYIFGTNAYYNNTATVESDGTFEISKKVVSPTKEDNENLKLAAGQYFLVIQHKMYDGKYNIGPVNNTVTGGIDIMLKEKGEFTDDKAVVIFNTNERQSSNAAQALCDALDSQNIDDMYVKASFIVAGATSYIDPVPSTVTKGQVLTVSGSTTGHKDDVVTVELLSTAFAAVPKETVGSASFVALSTRIGDDGVWSISFDTSNLNADEYTCSVAVADLDATTSKITIVEGTNPQPTQTTTPVTPTAQPTAQPTQTPATPGFGALAALAGLGAVAVLLLRRQ